MGAFYVSLQVADAEHDAVAGLVEQFRSENSSIAAHIGPKLGRWTAVYPSFGPQTDKMAAWISGEVDNVDLTLASLDEDSFLCNLCESGKDRGFFKATVGLKRSGKQRAPVQKRIDMLADYANETTRSALVDTLCDLRSFDDSERALSEFCRAFQISNALSSFDYIQAGDYALTLDRPAVFKKLSDMIFRG